MEGTIGSRWHQARVEGMRAEGVGCATVSHPAETCMVNKNLSGSREVLCLKGFLCMKSIQLSSAMPEEGKRNQKETKDDIPN